MTTEELLAIEWNPMRDYPKTRCPHNARTVRVGTVRNQYGTELNVRVQSNRTASRWWLVIGRQEIMLCYITTSSAKVRDSWLEAF